MPDGAFVLSQVVPGNVVEVSDSIDHEKIADQESDEEPYPMMTPVKTPVNAENAQLEEQNDCDQVVDVQNI